jgi:low temperature requirement protein LtrA
VVVLVAQAAHRLAGQLTWPGLGEFAVVFTLVWIAWTNGSLHHELHGHDDARARSTFLLQILVLAAMAAFVPQAGGARGAAFAVAAAVLFAVLALLWLLAARGDRPEYRRSSRLFVTGTAACAVLLAGTALLPASARIPAWGLLDVAYLAGFAAVLLTATPGTALTVTDALMLAWRLAACDHRGGAGDQPRRRTGRCPERGEVLDQGAEPAARDAGADTMRQGRTGPS